MSRILMPSFGPLVPSFVITFKAMRKSTPSKRYETRVRTSPPHTNSFLRKPKRAGIPKQIPAIIEKMMTFFMLSFCLTDFKALAMNNSSIASSGANKYFRKNNINGFILLMFFIALCHNLGSLFLAQTHYST